MQGSYRRITRTALYAASLISGSAMAQQPQPSASDGSSSSNVPKPSEDGQGTGVGVSDIIVTASRREESLQRLPQAVSVLTGDTQLARGQTRLEDLRVSIPNINFAATSNTSQFYIRGVGNTFLNIGGDPGVALYQDGAYISDQTTTNVNFFDVQRVEILRGPQGALYGRNATGGAINIISAPPTSVTRARLMATVGDRGRFETEGFVSGPLGIADTSARLSFQTKRYDGYTRNRLAGQLGAPSAFDDLDTQAFRIQTATETGNGGKLHLLVSHFRENDNGSALSVTPTPGVPYAAETLFGAVPSSDPRNIFSNLGSNRIRLTTANVNLEQPIGDLNLSATGNYRKSSQRFIADCDGTQVNNCTYFRRTDSDDYFGDVHLSSPTGGRFRWLVGANYLNFSADQLNDVVFPFPLSYIVPGGPTTVPFGFRVFAGGKLKVESYAVYADLRYQLTDIFALTGQIRYSHTLKSARELLQIPDFAINAVDVPARLSNASVPYKVGAEAQLTPDVLIYANYSTAFKDGAINLGALQTAPVREETVTNIEGGFKTSFLDRRVQLNGAAFYSRYKDLQISQLVGTVIALANAPRSRIYGVELELVAVPVPSLQLRANVGLLNAEIQEFSNSRIRPGTAAGPTENLAGRKLPYTSPVTASIGADYSFKLSEGLEARVGGEYSYRGRTYFDEFNDAVNSQAPVGIVNLSASFGQPDRGFRVFGYVNNLTDEKIATGATTYSGLIGAARAVSFAPPRTFGVGGSFAF